MNEDGGADSSDGSGHKWQVRVRAYSFAGAVRDGWLVWRRPLIIGAFAVFLNAVAYFLLPPRLLVRLGHFGYVSAFAIAALANATVLVPVPYYPIIARLAQTFNIWGVIVAAAAGSALGESVAFFVGRSGQGIIKKSQVNNWMHKQLRHPWRAGVVLFGLAAPPNPAFDVAGLLAGALGVPLRLFLVSVFLGRIIRMALVAFVGLRIGWGL